MDGEQNENQSSCISFRFVNWPSDEGKVEKLFFIHATDLNEQQSPKELGISSILFALKPSFLRFLSLPRVGGKAESWLWSIFSSYRLWSSPISSGKLPSWLLESFSTVSFFITEIVHEIHCNMFFERSIFSMSCNTCVLLSSSSWISLSARLRFHTPGVIADLVFLPINLIFFDDKFTEVIVDDDFS